MPDEPRWRRHAPYLGAILLVVCLRCIGLGVYPQIEADEGGWPLSVREWVETGTRTFDYYMAPGYHWLLGIPYRLFGSSHSVGRPVSALASLFGLWLFYRLVGRHAGETAAFWATLLLGTSYPAVLIDRRAFMEPLLLVIMFALCLAATGPGRSTPQYLLVGGLTCLLLLTKASGVFLLPALVLATFWSPGGGWSARPHRVRLMVALAAGALVAGGVFYWLYLGDPSTFLAGWATDMTKMSNVPGVASGTSGRFHLSPLSIEATLRWHASYEPVLFGLSLLGFLKAVTDRRHGLMGAWLTMGGLFFFLQVYIQANHRALLFPPLCYFCATLLCELDELARRAVPLPSVRWARAALVAIVLYSSGRLLGGWATARVADAEAIAWLKAHTNAQSTIVAAPYVLMRLGGHPVSFFRLGEPYVPTPAALQRWRPDWLVTETREWQHHILRKTGSLAPLDQALSECCEVAYRTPAATVYRVRNAPAARPAAGAPQARSPELASADR